MRLIDADNLAAKIMMEAPDFQDGGSTITKAFIMAMVKTRSVSPTIDAVPVVRCKDCKHWTKALGGQCNTFTVNGIAHCTSPDWFCADGEREMDMRWRKMP